MLQQCISAPVSVAVVIVVVVVVFGVVVSFCIIGWQDNSWRAYIQKKEKSSDLKGFAQVHTTHSSL